MQHNSPPSGSPPSPSGYTMLTANDLKGMLADTHTHALLVEFTTKNHTSENIHFLSAIHEFRLSVNKMVREIYDKYIDPDSDDCVNVDETVRNQITKQMAQPVAPITVFDPAETAIINLVVCEPLQDFASWAHDRGGLGKVVSTKKRDVYSVFKTDVAERAHSKGKQAATTPRPIYSHNFTKPSSEAVEITPESPKVKGKKGRGESTSPRGDSKKQVIKPPLKRSDERRKSVDQGEGIHLRNPFGGPDRSGVVERGFLFSDEFKAQQAVPNSRGVPDRSRNTVPTINCPPPAQGHVLPSVFTPSDEKRDVFETYLKYVDKKLENNVDKKLENNNDPS